MLQMPCQLRCRNLSARCSETDESSQAGMITMTNIGGPTALIEMGGLRLLTDPTFDPAGQEYRPGAYVLQKIANPAVVVGSLGAVDAVLLSHDHHFDNLDYAGRA